MRTDDADQLVSRYLCDLRKALGPLPGWRRQQLIDEIAQHIAQGRSELGAQDPASVAALLENVGDPSDIATEALGVSEEIPAPTLRQVGGLGHQPPAFRRVRVWGGLVCRRLLVVELPGVALEGQGHR
ncbi:MAG: HAAS signaling domain-containing protein [Acidimicrobiales bacterium]